MAAAGREAGLQTGFCSVTARRSQRDRVPFSGQTRQPGGYSRGETRALARHGCGQTHGMQRRLSARFRVLVGGAAAPLTCGCAAIAG